MRFPKVNQPTGYCFGDPKSWPQRRKRYLPRSLLGDFLFLMSITQWEEELKIIMQELDYLKYTD